MTADHYLLREYVQTRSPEAFRRIVDRYVDLVYSTARRQVRDAHLAEDVTQAVFLLLAQKASLVSTDRPVSAWLHRATGYVAANVRRSQSKREAMERRYGDAMNHRNTDKGPDVPWASVAPWLDEGLARLKPAERDVILLKFFEHRTNREVGDAVGISEQAAAKRVSRAVERLRQFFRRHGVDTSAALIGIHLAAHAVEAAPSGLASTASSAATAPGSLAHASPLLKGVTITMAMEKAKLGAIAVVILLLGVAGGGLVVINTISKPAPLRSVTTQPAVPASAALKFADGTVVALLGVAEGHGNATRWWNADGTPANDPQFPETRQALGATAELRELQIIFEGSVRPGISLRFQPSISKSYSSVGWVNAYNHQVAKVVALVPVDVSQIDFQVGLANGPETLTYVWQAGRPSSTAATVSEVGDMVTVEIPAGGQVQDQSIRAVLRNGQSLFPASNSYQPGTETWRFKCSKNDLQEIVLHSRTIEWQQMTGVHTMPGTPAATAPSHP